MVLLAQVVGALYGLLAVVFGAFGAHALKKSLTVEQLFSFSIYALVIGKSKGKNMKFLGPITPLGGLLLVVAWGLLLYSFIANFI
jgi:uncharacterized membrane protein YgdD (TMEM256/DUF423 family)